MTATLTVCCPECRATAMKTWDEGAQKYRYICIKCGLEGPPRDYADTARSAFLSARRSPGEESTQ